MKMKTNLIVTITLLALLSLGTNSFAAANESSANPGSAITLSGTDPDPDLTLAASPGVALYFDNGGDTQWYVISTYHEGGNRVFATAQNSTSVWYQDRSTGDDFSDVTGFPADSDEAVSAENWSTDGWSR